MMGLSEIISLLGILLSSIVFYIYAREVNKEKLTLDGFMLSNRNLSSSQFKNTFAASSFSLAMNTLFLFANCKNYAIFMLIAPVTYILGHYIFVGLIKKSGIDINDCRTVSDLCYKFFPSSAVAKLITIMTLSSYVMLVFIELYIGSTVLTFFLPEGSLYQTGSFLLIGILVLLYVRLGGYKALVRTDRWQLTLMTIATFLIALFAFIMPVANNASTNDIIFNMITPSNDGGDIFFFMIWLTVLNLMTPFTQIANWQRITATKNTSMSWKGLLSSTKNILFLFMLTLSGFMLLKAKGYDLSSIKDFLSLVKNSGAIGGYIIFPLMIVGFCSMVFSSADVAIISITYAIADQNSFLKTLSNLSETKLRLALTCLILIILVALSIIYWMQFTILHEWLLPLIYAICGQIAILTPLPVYILFNLKDFEKNKHIKISKKNKFLLFNGILIAWIIILLALYTSKVTGQQLWSQLSVPFGALIVFLVTRYIHKNLIHKGSSIDAINFSKTESEYS